MINKPVRVVLLGDADISFRRLNETVGKQIEFGKSNTEEMQLLRSIKQKIEFIKANPFYGDPIAKGLIPKEYTQQYYAKNLFRVELSGFWRMVYTLKGDKIEIVAFILDIKKSMHHHTLKGVV
ncbi:MAG: hypothetical protein AABW89_03920 [Nanoarchaeota archaeon]